MTLSFAILGSGTGAILVSYLSKRRLAFFILKPLTTLLIFTLVLASVPGSDRVYPVLIAAGLGFSLAGDIFLMLPTQHFLYGIMSFSVTHILYLVAFIVRDSVFLVHPLTLLFGVIAAALTLLIWRGIKPSLRIPVLLYVTLITGMAAQATGAAIALKTAGVTIAALGAMFFFLSDAILAVDRFRSPFEAARAAVLSSYWIGQWLIAMSTRPGYAAVYG